MKKRILKNLVSLAIIALVVVPFVGLATQVNAIDVGIDTVEQGFDTDNGLQYQDPRETGARIINVAITLLGIIAVAIILMGGFKWMTAGGNEDKVSEAKKLIGAGVVGLVIVLAAWGIARFLLESLTNATGN